MSDEKLSPYQILEQIYSEEGYSHGVASIRMDKSLDGALSFCKDEDGLFCLNFNDSKPIVRIGKTISFKTTISGLKMGANGGTIVVDKFPDIPFLYSWVVKGEGQVVGFDKEDLKEMFTRAAAQKLVNALLDTLVDAVVSSSDTAIPKEGDNE
jgi:hypothetical protein